MPKFSILIPAYKAAYLRAAIESVLSQTYSDFELIISDDCSPENLKVICEPFLTDSRVKYRSNESNMGAMNLASHWNLLLGYALGEYVIVPGDDDMFEPNYLEEVNRIIVKYPNIDLVRGRTRRIDSWGEVIEEDVFVGDFQSQEAFLESLFSLGSIHSMGNYVFKRSALFQKNGFIEFDLAWFSDDAAAILYSEKGVGHTKEVVFNFRRSELTISSLLDQRAVRVKAGAMCSFYRWYKQLPLFGGRENKLLRKVKDHCHGCILWDKGLTLMSIREILMLEKTFLSGRFMLCWLKRNLKCLFRGEVGL